MQVFNVLQTWSYFYSYKNITLPKVDEKKEQDRITVPYELAWEKKPLPTTE